MPCSSTSPSRIDPAIEVAFIDTGYHFPETLDTVEVVRKRYGLNLRMMTVAHHAEELWKIDPENCCSAVKVGQLDRALAGKLAWMSGLRRDEADTRTKSPIITRDLRGLVKINPIATWTDQDVWGVHRGTRRALQPPDQPGLRLHRLHALHPARRRGRASPVGPLGRARQVRVRPPLVVPPAGLSARSAVKPGWP